MLSLTNNGLFIKKFQKLFLHKSKQKNLRMKSNRNDNGQQLNVIGKIILNTFSKSDENAKSEAIIKVGRTNMNHILGIKPFHAQSFPSQKRMLSNPVI